MLYGKYRMFKWNIANLETILLLHELEEDLLRIFVIDPMFYCVFSMRYDPR